MRHIAVVLAVLLPLLSSAATISSTSCTSPDLSGCVTLSMATYPSTVSAVAVQATGTWVGTIEFQGSVDGTNYTALRGYPVGGGSYTTSTSANGAWTVLTGGVLYFRARATAWTSGTATVSLNVTSSPFMPDVIRAVGPTFGAVDTSGVVSLSNSTLGALGTESCTVGIARTLSVGTTAVSVPSSAMANRTRILIVNASENQDIRCVADPGGSNPTCTVPGVGLPIFQKGASVTFTVRDTVAVKCIACNSAAPVAYQEEACVPP